MLAVRAGAAVLLSFFFVACGDSAPSKAKPTALKENSRSLCIDRVDNDGDGATDCDDPDCEGLCNSQEVETACDDGEDNDQDGRVDCDDPNCGTPQGCGPENTDERCSDGRDNDSDDMVDCYDPDCRSSADVDFCGAENTADRCRDDLDNDQDGQVDCDDSDCAATVPCNPPAPENTQATCTDTRDNDGDGLIDCRDPNCRDARAGNCAPSETASLCEDTRDNDGDGTADCADSDCAQATPCQSVTPEADGTVCKNLVDDDGDGAIDCADASCRNAAAVTFCGTESAARCSDMIDNDGDGTKDCADSDCAAAPACAPVEREDTLAECSNSTDDDGDGRIDCKDSDCAGTAVCVPENTVAACSDDFDNDGDGAKDCADSECSTTSVCVNPENDSAECGDGNDNDSDGAEDCADSGCAGDARCQATETSCADDFDNDGDGDVDCSDSDCAISVDCTATTETSCTNGVDDDGDGFLDCADFDCLLDFTITACDTPALTVHDLQDASDNDAFTGTRGDESNDPVRLRGLVVQFVSPLDERDLYVADAGALGSYHGVRVFLRGDAQDAGLAAGDRIDVAGLVTELAGETEILAYGVRLDGTANLPAAIEVGIEALNAPLAQAERANDRYRTNAMTGAVVEPYDDTLVAERYEGTLVTLVDVEVVETYEEQGVLEAIEVAAAPYAFGDPTFFVGARYAEPATLPSIGQLVDSVTGILSYTRYSLGTGFLQQYRVEARVAGDWVFTPTVDSDGDGLSDADEEEAGTDPFDPDSDDDFFDDSFEVGDPFAPYDSDFDGIIDALDSFLLDVDGDNVPNEWDAWELIYPGDDRDGDGVINANDPDSDNDYVCDPGVTEGTGGCVYVNGGPDLCPYAPSSPASADWPESAGRNGDPGTDGSGDACDWDADGDFWPQPYDNCPFDANLDQADEDADGIGDECDLFAFSPLACSVIDNGGFAQCDLIIEEVLYNLSASAAGGIIDANRDDVTVSSLDEEFVEIRNVSVFDLDLSGVRIDDDVTRGGTSPRHRFPAGTVLRPGQRVVVFGGGNPSLFPSYVVVQTASSGLLGLNNGGDHLYLVDEADTVLADLDFSGATGADFNPAIDYNISATRYPDGTDTWAVHPEIFDAVNEAYWSISPGSAPDNGYP